MPPQGLGLWPGQAWVAREGQRPRLGLMRGGLRVLATWSTALCRQGGSYPLPWLIWTACGLPLSLLHILGVGEAAEREGAGEPTGIWIPTWGKTLTCSCVLGSLRARALAGAHLFRYGLRMKWGT